MIKGVELTLQAYPEMRGEFKQRKLDSKPISSSELNNLLSDNESAKLNLSNRKIDDSIVSKIVDILIAKKCDFESINLSNNNIKDNGARYIARLIHAAPPQLVYISLYSNNITDEGVKILLKAITQNPWIEAINFHHSYKYDLAFKTQIKFQQEVLLC